MQSCKRHLLVVVCFLLAGRTFSQQIRPAVKLKDLLKQVDRNAPSLRTDSAAINIRQAQAAETRTNWLPNFKLNYQTDIGTNNNDAGPYFGLGIIPSNSRGVRIESKSNAVLTTLGIAALDWEIYNFGAYGAQNRVASSDLAVEQNRFEQSKYQLEAYTIDNYLQLMQLGDLLALQTSNIRRNQEIERSIHSLATSGIRPGVDTSIAQAELSKARLNYIELENQFKRVQMQLASVTGLPSENIIPDTGAESGMIKQLVRPLMMTSDTSPNPLISYYKSIYQSSLLREDLVKRQYNPKILFEAAAWGRGSSVDAKDQFNSLSSGWGFNRNNYLVGIGISYNLFDLRRRQVKLHTQKAATDYAQKQLEEQKAALSLSVDQADLELNTAKERLQEIPNQLKAASAGYRQKLSLYRSGLTDIMELNAALNILYRAETDYVQAKSAYTRALFQKAFSGNQVNSLLTLFN